jgi:hypothetical protein
MDRQDRLYHFGAGSPALCTGRIACATSRPRNGVGQPRRLPTSLLGDVALLGGQRTMSGIRRNPSYNATTAGCGVRWSMKSCATAA